MREVKRRSPWPVYIAAGVYALCALVLPLYRSWHFLLAAVITAAAWLAADKLIKPKIEYVPEPPPAPEPPKAPSTPQEAILAEAAAARREMEKLAASIGDAAVGEKIARLAQLSDRIAKDAADDPADIPQIQKFQRYFLPSTIQLLHAYDRMSAPDLAGENTDASKARIVQMLDTEISAFQKQLDALYKNDAMDVDADIRVMRQLLDREGLGGSDEIRDILKKAKG